MNSELLAFGALGAIFVILAAYQDWRIAVKCALVLVLVEGALRKWAFPGASDLIYFAKDVILIGAYARFYQEKRFEVRDRWGIVPFSLIVVCGFLLLFHAANPNAGSVLASILGARSYLFYLPLVVVMPHLFKDMSELKWNLAIYLLLTIPIGILGIVQFKSGAFSVVNTYASGTNEWGASTFGVSDNVRITGTFSYLSGHVVFVVTMFALNVATLCIDRIPFRGMLTFVSLPLLVAGGFMSGARAALLAIAFVGIGFMLASAVSASARFRSVLSTLLVATVGVGISIQFFFTDAAEKSLSRLQGAGDSVYYRTVQMPLEHMQLAFEKGGLFGCGLGATNTSVQSFRSKFQLPEPMQHPGFYDNELAQILAEAGLVGFMIWYFIRIAIALALWRTYKSCNDTTFKLLSLCALLGYLPFMLISLVLNHVACMLVWSLVGLGFTGLYMKQTVPVAKVGNRDTATARRFVWARDS